VPLVPLVAILHGVVLLFYHDLDFLDEVIVGFNRLSHCLLNRLFLLHVDLRVEILLVEVVVGVGVAGAVVVAELLLVVRDS